MRLQSKALSLMRVCIIDTRDMLGVFKMSNPALRCQYVECMLDFMDYAVETLPWEISLLRTEFQPHIEDSDLRCFFSQLIISLKELGYEGEPLIVSPSKGHLVLLHFFKESL